jgi:hypothetical protein
MSCKNCVGTGQIEDYTDDELRYIQDNCQQCISIDFQRDINRRLGQENLKTGEKMKPKTIPYYQRICLRNQEKKQFYSVNCLLCMRIARREPCPIKPKEENNSLQNKKSGVR